MLMQSLLPPPSQQLRRASQALRSPAFSRLAAPRTARAPCCASAVAISASPEAVEARTISSAALSLALCNISRVCMSVAILPVALQFGWEPAVSGLVQSSFLWGYTASQAQGGELADAHGGRSVVALAIALFSVFTLLTPLALLGPSAAGAPGLALPLLLLTRAAVGLGQGLVMPSVTNLLAQRVPPQRRASAVGLAFAGFHGGTIAGLLLSPLLLSKAAWPFLFYAIGLLGLPVLALFLAAAPARDAGGAPPPPAPRPSLSAFLSSRSVWAILAANAVNHCCYFIFLFMMPTYFFGVWGLDVRSSALYSLLPWAAMGATSYASGALADSLLPRLGPTRVRKAAQAVAFLGPALLLWVLLRCGSPQQALACLTLALGLASFGQAGFVSNIQDVGGRNAGRLFGLANTVGCLAGIAGTTAAGLILQHGSWTQLFQLQTGLYLAGAAVFTLNAGSAAEF